MTRPELTPEQWAALQQMAESGDGEDLRKMLVGHDYREPPADPETFLYDQRYLGHVGNHIWPAWKNDLIEVMDPKNEIVEWILTGAIGIGKGHPVTERVLTPGGWKKVGDIRQGDCVIGSDGMPTHVQDVYPRGELPVYRVTFDDGASVLVDGEHLWAVQTPSGKHRGRPWRTIATDELIEAGVKNGNQRKWHIPVVEPVVFDVVELPIDPYALGALIGDGGLTQGGIRFSTADTEIMEQICIETGLQSRRVSGKEYDYHLSWGGKNGKPNPVLDDLRKMGLCVRSEKKRIPQVYLRGSIEERIRLLRGLMDTDGWVQNGGKSSLFCTTSPTLADDVTELVRSLGGIARRSFKTNDYLGCHLVDVNVRFNPFWVERKANEWLPAGKYVPRRMIESIEPEGTAEVVCLRVYAGDSLYVTEDYIVTHNTTMAISVMAYKIYRLLCLSDPYAYYNQPKINRFYFGLYNVYKYKGREMYDKLKSAINLSPWFMENFPVNVRKKDVMEFPDTITVVPGASEIDALGENLVACHMSEVNFMRVGASDEEKGQAWRIYDNATRRIKSRFMFQGNVPGILILDSSRRTHTDMLEEHLREVAGNPHVKVSEGALWDYKPKIHFTGHTFRVAVGDQVKNSTVLEDNQPSPHGMQVIDVPVEYREDFIKDIDGSLRDIAGIATYALRPYFPNRELLVDAVDTVAEHPFTQESICLSTTDSYELADYLVREKLVTIERSRYTPRLGKGKLRFVHCDLSRTRDSTGFAMGYVEAVKWSDVYADDIDAAMWFPVVRMELMLEIKPPTKGEIDYAKIRRFLAALRDMGFEFGGITFDGYQSADMCQILNRAGYPAEVLSLDRAPCIGYQLLRSAVTEHRIKWYHYSPFLKEVTQLQRDEVKEKVDHPRNGSKDISDAVAGVVWQCCTNEAATGEPEQVPQYDGYHEMIPTSAPPEADAPFRADQLLGGGYKG